MEPQPAPTTADAAHEAPLPKPGADRQPERPWRTEGVPKNQPAKPRRWTTTAIWVLGYLVLFGIFTVQDRLSGPQPIPYTEFKSHVGNKNVAELFAQGDSIEGQLKKAAPVAGQQDRTYQQFTTERPTFASDDLLAELTTRAARWSAPRRSSSIGAFLTNLLISLAPLLLLVAFYVWMFRRQRGAMAGGLLGGGKQKRVDPETVRVTFDDVAGIDEVEAEINEVVDFLKDPGKYRRSGPVRRRACCSPALRGPARRCSPVPPPVKRRCRSSAPAPRSSSR